ncbi:serine hydrolase [Candidatus Saccharibacteria bacterium]|nr:serine hydrolase [Candidatus Saccharibacteria bacterium]
MKKRDRRRRKISPIVLIAIFGVVVVVFFTALMFFTKKSSDNFDSDEQNIEEVEEVVETKVEIPKVDFQAVVEEWANSVGGNRSVLIYDLDREELVADYNSDEDYNTASLYKLFVVYEGYRRLESGEWLAEEYAGGTGKTILECLDLAIRESNSSCAETLWVKIGEKNLDKIIEDDFGILNSEISSLLSNPRDILKIMQIFYHHDEIKDESLVAKIKDSFLNQPVTTYDWRQGLPSGFSQANVYNKVGWDYNADGNYWNIYHDAAIVEFPEENRHFIVVVMTNQVSHRKIRELGTIIETEFFKQYNN